MGSAVAGKSDLARVDMMSRRFDFEPLNEWFFERLVIVVQQMHCVKGLILQQRFNWAQIVRLPNRPPNRLFNLFLDRAAHFGAHRSQISRANPGH